MSNLEKTFELCELMRTWLQGQLQGSATTCTRTFSFLPLRYGAVGGSASQKGQLPFLPPHLSRPTKVGRLSESAYALRPLREGFLYVLIKRKEAAYAWHSQYRVSAIGVLDFIDADRPWAQPAPTFGPGAVKTPTWMLRLHDMDGIDELRFLYSPAPLTQTVRDRFRQLAKYRDTMTSVDIAGLLSAEPPIMPNVLTRNALDLITDFAADSKPTLKEHLKTLAFLPLPPPRQAVSAEMRPAAGRDTQGGVAIVLNDALGMVQELNAWRNASSDSLDTFMAKEDEEKVDNQRKFTIAFAIDNIRKLVEDEAEASYRNHQNTIGVRYTDPEYQAGNRYAVVQSSGNYQSFRNPTQQRQVQDAAIKAARASSWDKYAPYIDEQRRQDFLERYQDEVAKADAARDARTADHLLWLQSEQLLDALEVFDRDDTEQALLFEDQMGKAIAGMNATEAGQALLERWREAEISRENLYWRSLAQNQQAAEDEVAALYEARSTLEDIDPVALQDRLKKLAVVYDRAHAFMDELAAGTGGPPSSYLVGGAMLINTLGNSLLQNKPATLLDKAANKVAAAVLQAQLGRYAQNIQLEMRGGKPLGRGASARIDRAAQRSFDDALRGGRHGPMVEMRLGGVLAVLDVWNLLNKLAVEDKGGRQYAELVAAILAVTAAGVEIGAAAVALGSRSGSTAVQQGAKVFGGGLRLGAGVLAGTAGLVGAWYDFQDAYESRGHKRYSLAGVYLLRAVTQMGSATLSITAGLAFARPYLEYLLKQYGTRPILGVAVRSSLQASTALALRMIPMLRLFFGLNMVILALVLVEIVLFPNQLQRYLDTCTFRKNLKNKGIDNEKAEVTTMQKALEGTL